MPVLGSHRLLLPNRGGFQRGTLLRWRPTFLYSVGSLHAPLHRDRFYCIRSNPRETTVRFTQPSHKRGEVRTFSTDNLMRVRP